MDLFKSMPPSTTFEVAKISHLIPYLILALNCILFKLLRSLTSKIFTLYFQNQTVGSNRRQQQKLNGKWRLIKLFVDELISTCELCADCAELNVVYEKHGSIAYGVGLFILSYLWLGTFGDAHTTPGYLVEDYVLTEGNRMLKTGDAYARFVGQSIAMPLAWRLASFYWNYKLLVEHQDFLAVENCKTSLTTSTTNGFLIEFSCCMICRLIELVGHKLHGDNRITQRVLSTTVSFGGTLLVVLALELSGGYFNPVLAASLEYGCRGIDLYQHAVVFWLGPLLGHVLAKGLFDRYGDQVFGECGTTGRRRSNRTSDESTSSFASNKRLTRSNSQRNKQKKH